MSEPKHKLPPTEVKHGDVVPYGFGYEASAYGIQLQDGRFQLRLRRDLGPTSSFTVTFDSQVELMDSIRLVLRHFVVMEDPKDPKDPKGME